MARATALLLVSGIVFSLAVAVALAGFMHVSRLSQNISYIGLPVKVEPGRISGSPDIEGTIDVQVGPNLTVNITVHPTYQLTAYPGLVNITNTGNITYFYSVIVTRPYDQPPGALAYLMEFNASNSTLVFRANLSEPGVYGPYPIGPGETIELSLIVYYPEGQPLQNGTATFIVAVSTQEEEPPQGLAG